MSDDFDITKIEIKIPKYYKYNEDWCERNIISKYNLDKICKNSSAEFYLCDFLTDIGQDLYNAIKKDNIKFKKLNDEKLQGILKKESQGFYNLRWQLRYCGLGEDTSFENQDLVDELEEILELYNYQLAPKVFKDAAEEVIAMAERGLKQINKVINYLNKLENEYKLLEREKLEERYSYEPINKDYLSSKWEQIELKHVKVHSGFIYALSNELMPGIYKVGFTARNPDERASEISNQVNLPSKFVVEKYWRTNDPYIVEQRIHESLSEYAEGKEFFKGNLKDICKIIDDCVESNNKI
tara:strand:- start:609 stop:1499 length:891 start_codon:yes stop_codon:yes gene_type:complete